MWLKLARNIDLTMIGSATLALVPIVILAPFLQAIRLALGLPFVLFFPGYAVISALFPRKDDLEPVERIALSFGLSIAVVPLIGLALNYSPWGIRLNPILASLSLFTIIASIVAGYRRERQAGENAFVIPLNLMLSDWRRWAIIDRLFAAGIALAVIGLGVAIYLAATRGSGERFTEFYILGPAGKAEGYPREAVVGQPISLILGIINREGETTGYSMQIRIDGQPVDDIPALQLGDDSTWERPITFAPAKPGQRQKVEFLLFKSLTDEPYRSLHLWLDVKDPTAAASNPPPVAAMPTSVSATEPTLTPTPTAMPALQATPTPTSVSSRLFIRPGGTVYIVQRGDTLSVIAARFGLSVEALLAANGMATGEHIVAGQEVLVPGVVYTVQPGDTLFGIARAFGVPQAVIMAANGITNPEAIYWGQTLIIPGLFR